MIKKGILKIPITAPATALAPDPLNSAQLGLSRAGSCCAVPCPRWGGGGQGLWDCGLVTGDGLGLWAFYTFLELSD